MVYGQYLDTFVGRIYVAVENGGVVRLTKEKAESGDVVVDETGKVEETAEESLALLKRTVTEVREYLDGNRMDFDIPVNVSGTPFQKRVWDALCRIPYGETRTYGEIARAVGSPRGARAVGMACGQNPVMILIPCHRVIGSTGKLVGFAGGLSMKESLLKLEKNDRK